MSSNDFSEVQNPRYTDLKIDYYWQTIVFPWRECINGDTCRRKTIATGFLSSSDSLPLGIGSSLLAVLRERGLLSPLVRASPSPMTLCSRSATTSTRCHEFPHFVPFTQWHTTVRQTFVKQSSRSIFLLLFFSFFEQITLTRVFHYFLPFPCVTNG